MKTWLGKLPHVRTGSDRGSTFARHLCNRECLALDPVLLRKAGGRELPSLPLVPCKLRICWEVVGK